MPAAEAVPGDPLRGSPHRLTDHMESFQRSYVSAVAAASGVLVSDQTPDEGIDLFLTHRSAAHLIDAARLEVSLKATRTMPSPKATHVSVQIAQNRYEYLRTPDPIVPKILVMMVVPQAQDGWISASAQHAELRHAAYWINLDDGRLPSTAASPTVSVPLASMFDDRSLCDIMRRVGQGGKP